MMSGLNCWNNMPCKIGDPQPSTSQVNGNIFWPEQFSDEESQTYTGESTSLDNLASLQPLSSDLRPNEYSSQSRVDDLPSCPQTACNKLVDQLQLRSSEFTKIPAVSPIMPEYFLENSESAVQQVESDEQQGTLSVPGGPSDGQQMFENNPFTSCPVSVETNSKEEPLSPSIAFTHLKPMTPEEVEQSPPSSKVEPSQHHTNSTMVMTSVPVPVTTNTLPKTVMLCSLSQQAGHHTLILPQLQQSSHIAPVMGTVDVPVLNDNEGEYGFTVTVEDKERTMKSPMWLMSRITNKLYTNINKAVPFEIHLKKPIKNQMFSIRAVPVFSSPQFLRHNVNRCPNHAAPTDSTNHDFPYPEHVVRADHPEARYIKSASGRLSVVVPVDPLQDGSDYTPILLRFMCLGSCVGGINRRPIAIILTLENSSGKECGRKVIDVRVCACPTRDIKTDEQAILYKGGKRKASVMQQEKVPLVTRKKPRAVDPKTEPQEEDKMFLIPVRGQKLYNFLMDMKAVYYRNHPEYAAKYPDDDINSSTIEMCGEKLKERCDDKCNIEEVEMNPWDSDGYSPHRLVYDDTHSDSFNLSSEGSSDHLQSHASDTPTVKVRVVDTERNGREPNGSVSIQNNEIHAWPQVTEDAGNSHFSSVAFVSSLSSASAELHSQSSSKFNIVTLPKVNLSKHVPVVQVSSYNPREPAVRKYTSEFKMGNIKASLPLSKSFSMTQKQLKETGELGSLRLWSDSTLVQKVQSPHERAEASTSNVSPHETPETSTSSVSLHKRPEALTSDTEDASNSHFSSVAFVSSLSSASAELHRQSSSKFDILNLPLNLSKHGPVVQVSSHNPREPAVRKYTSVTARESRNID